MSIQKVVVREIGKCVQAVSDKLAGWDVWLPDGTPDQSTARPLTEYNCDIQRVSYFYGHAIEIRETLQSWDRSPTYRGSKYPCVLLFEDIPISYGGPHAIARMGIVIATFTKPDIKSVERQQTTFDPVLTPIYDELLNQIYRNQFFRTYNRRRDMQHTRIDRKYWGREIVGGTDLNKLEDYLDAIEIRDLQLKLSNARC